jgi:hypothetical protein
MKTEKPERYFAIDRLGVFAREVAALFQSKGHHGVL